jgi:hypothetical protein
VRVKFLIYDETTQRTCLRLMGRKMLVALMMEGKFSGEGIHSLDADDDLLAAMARELVEQGGVGQSADAVWEELRRERAAHAAAAAPEFPKVEDREDPPMMSDMFRELPAQFPAPAAGPILVESKPKPKNKLESIWPSGYVVGDQLRLFG